MINPKDLRIGNYLQRKESDTVIQVDVDMLSVSELINYAPVILSPKILEKCGFVKPTKNDNHGGLLVSIGNDVSIRLKPLISVDGYYWDNFNGAYKVIIKHLHQLQNLYFALTGEELNYTI